MRLHLWAHDTSQRLRIALIDHRLLQTYAKWIAARGQLRVGARRAGEIIWARASPDVARMLYDEIGWTESQHARWLADTLIRTLLPDERSGQPVNAVSPSDTSDRHASPGSRCGANCPGSRWAVSGGVSTMASISTAIPSGSPQSGDPDGGSGGSTDAVTEGMDQ